MPPKIKRLLITALVLALGAIIVWSVFQGAGRRGTSASKTPAEAPDRLADEQGGASTPPDQPVEEPAAPPERPGSEPTIGAPPETGQAPPEGGAGQAAGVLRFREQPPEALLPLGNLEAESNTARLRLDFSPCGAGVSQVTLADYYRSRRRAAEERYTLFDGAWERRPVLGLRRVYVNGQRVDAYDESAALAPATFRQTGPGAFEAVVVDEQDRPVLTIWRRYELGPKEGQVTLRQGVRNETSEPLEVIVEQWGPGDLPYLREGYGDYRRVRFGYLDERSAEVVLASESDFLLARGKVLTRAIKRARETGDAPDSNLIWPNETSRADNLTLSWVATTNRYFGFAVHRAVDDPEQSRLRALEQVSRVEVWIESRGETALSQVPDEEVDSRYLNLKFVGNPVTLAPGQERKLDLGVYAGPLRGSLLAGEQPYRAFNLKELIVYQLGCAWCTFQTLTHFLLWFLRLIEGDVIILGGIGLGVHDWGAAIIILVFIVRLILHPLTKKGQVSMQRLSRNMAKLQPEIKKLQEKYKDNPKKLQQEQMALYREHNINPAGCLGILPMLLQTPIWVALYAMLYFAIELRQQPAFYGVFQLFGDWSFLADLSQPDHFIEFARSFRLPLLGWAVTGVNLLPILMGVIFYLQQKYLTPPNPNMTPEMEQQQKIMRIVFPLLFPIMLYTAPSGLTLYIITSSTIGILESRYIRAHIDALDLDRETAGATPRAAKPVVNQAPRHKRER